jgi:hypothetical protein
MDLDKSFVRVAPRSIGTAAPLVQSFFKATGYRKVSEKPLAYRRGSLFGTWMSFTPSRWATRAAVDLRMVRPGQTEVIVKLHVNDTGQAVTDAERKYWDLEFAALEKAVVTGETDAASLEDSARAVASSGLRTVLVLVAGATSFFVVTYLLGYMVKRLIS